MSDEHPLAALQDVKIVCSVSITVLYVITWVYTSQWLLRFFVVVVTSSDNKRHFFVKLCFFLWLLLQSLWKQTLYPCTCFIWTSILSCPSVRAKAAIREMNKLAESFFFLLSAENTASHSIRMKLAIPAISHWPSCNTAITTTVLWGC